MPDINITVAHKVAVSDTQTIVCDNSDYTVHWTLDEEWSAYDTKTMRTIYMDGTFEDKVFSGDTIELPVCTVPGAVQIGLFAGNLRTSRVAILRALPSVRSVAGAPADPTPDVYDQLMELIKGLGGADPDDIAKAVADYLAAHPSEETDPTVPEWAKAETKPTYSAAEVGAIAQSDLQAATDAALAQAKASGEFDGATGPAGPQGPAGVPGKDGADGKPGEKGADGADGIYYGTTQPTGDTHPVWIDPNGMPDELDLSLGITGASVGQIAKIAAVDASGVPTAWSPVDMSSGGGGETWELIRSLELSADVAKVAINEDNAGNAFALKKAYIRITMAIPTDTSITSSRTVCVDTVAADPWGVGKVFLGTSPSISEKSKRYCFSAFETFAGKFLPIFIKASYGASVPNAIVSGMRYDEKGAIDLKDGDIYGASPCKSLCFGSYQPCLYAGTTIEIYGVRE